VGVNKVHYRFDQGRRRRLIVRGRDTPFWDPYTQLSHTPTPAHVVAVGAPSAVVAPPPPPGGFPGEPPVGKVYVGVREETGDNVVTRYETPAGAVLGVHRVFFQTSQSDATMAAACETELAAGRLPWISFKTPQPWSTITQGYLENRIGVIADITSGPVWLSVWHEPEDNVNASNPIVDWLTLQELTGAALGVLAPHNIAFAPVLQGWTWHPSSGRDADDWWTPDAGWDFFGVDPYYSQEGPLYDYPGWNPMTSWIDGHGLKMGVAEWGIDPNDPTPSASKATYMQQTWDNVIAETSPVITCMAYYDSDGGSENWRLDGTFGTAPLTKFRELMGEVDAYHYDD